MDTRCPHCKSDLGNRRVVQPQRAGSVAAGDATLCCPFCQGGLLLNIHPAEGQLPLRFDPELAVYAVLGTAIALAAILAPLIPPIATLFAVITVSVLGLIAHSLYFYRVTAAHWPRYKVASLRFIKQISPPR